MSCQLYDQVVKVKIKDIVLCQFWALSVSFIFSLRVMMVKLLPFSMIFSFWILFTQYFADASTNCKDTVHHGTKVCNKRDDRLLYSNASVFGIGPPLRPEFYPVILIKNLFIISKQQLSIYARVWLYKPVRHFHKMVVFVRYYHKIKLQMVVYLLFVLMV